MSLILLILCITFLPVTVSTESTYYVFLIDENNNPIVGYRVIETHLDNVFISSLDPMKKWISNVRSEMVLVKAGYLYSVVDSVIVNKKIDMALLLTDVSKKRPLNFIPEEYQIKGDLKKLVENKHHALAKIKMLFPEDRKIKESKREDLISLANQFKQTGQFSKALEIYEAILSKNPKEERILEEVAMLFYKVGEYQKAKEFFLKIPLTKERLEKFVGILIITKDYSFAQRLIDSLPDKSAYVHYLKGIIHYLKGEKDEAYRELIILSRKDENLAQNLRDLLR